MVYAEFGGQTECITAVLREIETMLMQNEQLCYKTKPET